MLVSNRDEPVFVPKAARRLERGLGNKKWGNVLKSDASLKSKLGDISHDQLTETLRPLNTNGVSLDDLRKIRAYPEFAAKIAHLIKDWDIFFNSVMRGNYFGPSDWLEYFNIKVEAKMPPWKEPFLGQNCPIDSVYNLTRPLFQKPRMMHTHFLFYMPEKINNTCASSSIQTFNDLKKKPLLRVAMENRDTSTDKFMRETKCNPGWHLIYLDRFPTTSRKPWEEQLKRLPNGYEVPTAIEIAWMMRLYVTKTPISSGRYIHLAGERLRCRDLSDDGMHPTLWNSYPGHEITIVFDRDEYSEEIAGIAASCILPASTD